MGLGIYATAGLRRKRAFGLMSSLARPKDVEEAFLACAKGTPLQRFARIDGRWGAETAINLHPQAEALFMKVEGENLTVDTKTSSAGAGYHAFVIDCLRKVEKDLGLAWNWAELDETGFAADGDFPKLQEAMRGLQRFIFQTSIKSAAAGRQSNKFSMPVDFGVIVGPGESATSLGPMPDKQVEALARDPGTGPAAAIDVFFAWPDKGYGASFFRGLALGALWCDMRWARPIDDAERKRLAETAKLCAEATRLGGPDAIPREAIVALDEILSGKMNDDFPSPKGVGYRRQNFLGRLPGGHWTLEVPGSLVHVLEDEGRTETWWNGAITVRGSTITGERKKPEPDQTRAETQWERKLEFNDDEQAWVLMAHGEAHPAPLLIEACVVSVWFKDRKHEPLAARILDSVKFAPPAKPERPVQ
jgi:hypothetical protein